MTYNHHIVGPFARMEPDYFGVGPQGPTDPSDPDYWDDWEDDEIPMMFENPLKQGQWILWTTEHHAKRGEVTESKGVSIVVRWLDGEEQVFPNVQCYVGPDAGLTARMVAIERPKEASRIERERKRGVMSITRAASSLGTTPKRVRAMLRSGQLRGVRKDGKWISVEL